MKGGRERSSNSAASHLSVELFHNLRTDRLVQRIFYFEATINEEERKSTSSPLFIDFLYLSLFLTKSRFQFVSFVNKFMHCTKWEWKESHLEWMSLGFSLVNSFLDVNSQIHGSSVRYEPEVWGSTRAGEAADPTLFPMRQGRKDENLLLAYHCAPLLRKTWENMRIRTLSLTLSRKQGWAWLLHLSSEAERSTSTEERERTRLDWKESKIQAERCEGTRSFRYRRGSTERRGAKVLVVLNIGEELRRIWDRSATQNGTQRKISR